MLAPRAATRTAHSTLLLLATLVRPPQCAASRSSGDRHCANLPSEWLPAAASSSPDSAWESSVWHGDSRSAPAQMPSPSRGNVLPAQTRAGSTACLRGPPGPASVAGAAAGLLSVSSKVRRFLL